MTDYEKLLSMIEGVDPDDTDTLDEINARVWCYQHKCKYCHKGIPSEKSLPSEMFRFTVPNGDFGVGDTKYTGQYTRSRDALKAIRPRGWGFDIGHSTSGLDWQCEMDLLKGAHFIMSPHLPTEELAELHVIIQAIEWGRKNEHK